MTDRTAAERMRRHRERKKAGIVERKKDQLIAAGLLQPADRDNDAAVRAAEDRFWAKCPADSVADAVPGAISGEIREKSDISVENPAVEPVKAPSRPSTKAEALTAYRELLGGVELPNDLVRASRAADLEAAQASLQRFVDDAERGQGYDWAQIRLKWRLLQCDPGRLAVEYGIPLLESAIRDRQQAEANAARAARLSKGLTILFKLAAQTICGLGQRGFLRADCEDPAELIAAVLRAIEFTLELPEEQLRMPASAHAAGQTSFPPWGARRVIPPVVPDHGDEGADPEEADGDPEEEDRKIAALKKLRNLLGGGRLPSAVLAEAEAADLEQAIESCLSLSGTPPSRQPTPSQRALQRSWELHQRSPEMLVELFGTPFLEAAIYQRKTEQAKIAREKRLAAGANILLPLSQELIAKLLHRFAPMANPEDEAAVRAAVHQAIAIALDPPPPPIPQVSLLDYPLMTHPGADFRRTLGR